MKPSTARHISYNLRPAKQVERRILLDFLKCAVEVGFPISTCRYVGMGGTTFYDFRLLHRFLGINNMISLERDPDMHRRSTFNCPFDFIKVRNEPVSTFLAADKDEVETIYWLDYDDSLNVDVVKDITMLGTRLKVGGLAFVTVCAQPPGALAKQNAHERLENFLENFGELAAGLTTSELSNAEFPRTVYRILMKAFRRALVARRDGGFLPLFRVQYRDSTQMLTIGGCFCTRNARRCIITRVKNDLPFLLCKEPYKLENLNLTEREKVLFDMAATKQTPNREEKIIYGLGFKRRDLDNYRDLIRFLPRYHESII